MTNYSILIDCPDEYLDILELFFIFLEANWKDRKAHIYISTQESEISHPENVTFIKCGFNKNSIERSIIAINSIKEDYILTLCCDNYPAKIVDDYEISNLVNYMKNTSAKYIQIWRLKNKEQRKYPTNYKGLYFCNKKARYSRSLMANIWDKKEYLRVFSNLNQNGWAVEGMWLKECLENKPGYIKDYYYCNTDPIKILHTVSKGCWIRSSYRKMKKIGIKKGLLSKRKKLSLWNSLKYCISMYLFNHVSSKTFFNIKRINRRNKSFATKY